MAITFLGSMIGTHAATTAQTVTINGITGLKDSSGAAVTLLQDDIVLVFWENSSTLNRTIAGGANIGVPAGFTGIGAHNYQDDSNDSNFRASYKFMTSSPNTTVAIPPSNATTAGVAYSIYAFRGVDTTTPLDVAAVYTGGVNGAVANAAAITPTTAGAWIVIGAGAAQAAATGSTVFTPPTGTSSTTNHFQTTFISSTTNDAVIGVALKTDWSSGAYDPPAFGGSSSTNTGSWSAVTIALRPGASDTTGPVFANANTMTCTTLERGSLQLDATDAVTGQSSLIWEISGGANSSKFALSAGTGVTPGPILRAVRLPPGTYVVDVTVYDALNNTTTQTITHTVTGTTQTIDSRNGSGSTTFTVPAGVTSIIIEATQAGSNGLAGTVTDPGQSGDGGSWAEKTAYSVTPGQIIYINIAAGGNRPNRGVLQIGTTVGGSDILAFTAAGVVTGSTASFAGGSGAFFAGGASATGAGVGFDDNFNALTDDGGAGGAAGSGVGVAGLSGGIPGGGGGGGGAGDGFTSGTWGAGGSGGAGRVRIFYAAASGPAPSARGYIF